MRGPLQGAAAAFTGSGQHVAAHHSRSRGSDSDRAYQHHTPSRRERSRVGCLAVRGFSPRSAGGGQRWNQRRSRSACCAARHLCIPSAIASGVGLAQVCHSPARSRSRPRFCLLVYAVGIAQQAWLGIGPGPSYRSPTAWPFRGLGVSPPSIGAAGFRCASFAIFSSSAGCAAVQYRLPSRCSATYIRFQFPDHALPADCCPAWSAMSTSRLAFLSSGSGWSWSCPPMGSLLRPVLAPTPLSRRTRLHLPCPRYEVFPGAGFHPTTRRLHAPAPRCGLTAFWGVGFSSAHLGGLRPASPTRAWPWRPPCFQTLRSMSGGAVCAGLVTAVVRRRPPGAGHLRFRFGALALHTGRRCS